MKWKADNGIFSNSVGINIFINISFKLRNMVYFITEIAAYFDKNMHVSCECEKNRKVGTKLWTQRRDGVAR